MQAADHFKQLPLFADLSPEEIVDVLRIARLSTWKAGAKLCARGERAECAFLIEQGQVAVRVAGESGAELEVARIGNGEIVGELALVDGNPRSADVVALTDVRGYRIDRSEFDAMRRAMHPAAFKILRRIAITVSDRLRDLNEAIAHELASGARAAPEPEASPRPSDPGRASRAQQRASREIGRASQEFGRISRAGAAPRPAASGSSGPRQPVPGAEPAGATESPSMWRSMLDRISGASWK